jgi:nucleoside-diphosphate-sugar epimerase
MPQHHLVVGANGYIGRRLLFALGESGTVRATSSAGGTGRIRVDLAIPESFSGLSVARHEIVYFAAALSNPEVCSEEPDRAWAINVSGTSALIDRLLAQGARVIFLSSDTVYGEQADPISENAACHPLGAYAEMKHAVEQHFLGHSGFKSLRLSYVFSREDKFSTYIQRCAANGTRAEIFDPFKRAVIHRDDVVDGLLGLARCWDEFPQAAINFGGPEIISRLEFAQTLKDHAFRDLLYEAATPPPKFFDSRPRSIAMRSPLLTGLLGRMQRSIAQAAILEFKDSQSTN